jgi:type III secretory pathway component EscU
MSLANMLSALLAAVVLGLAAWHFVGGRRRLHPADDAVRRRRTVVAWEVRAMTVAVAGPLAAGILFRYLSTEYTLPLLLFLAAGVLAAGLIALSDEHAHH